MMAQTITSWLIGLIISLLIGGLLSEKIVSEIRINLLKRGIIPDGLGEPAISPWLLGIIERTFFTTIVAFEGPVAAAMIGWITLKMVTDWNRSGIERKNASPFALSGLIGSLVSMFWALIGGLICARKIWWWPFVETASA